jgi:hypothetical protein
MVLKAKVLPIPPDTQSLGTNPPKAHTHPTAPPDGRRERPPDTQAVAQIVTAGRRAGRLTCKQIALCRRNRTGHIQ